MRRAVTGWLTIVEYMRLLDNAYPRFGPLWVFHRQDNWKSQVCATDLAIKTATIVAYDRQLTGGNP